MSDFNEIVPVQTTATVAIEQNRAMHEVQAAYVIAKKFPRDQNAAYTRVIESCKRISLAEKAMYSYPRGGKPVTGPSIRLAEVLAQNYGNLDFGIREIERKNGVSIAESYCVDLETNTRQTKQFEVPHEYKANGVMKKITDQREIYELVANNAARRLRACILGVIPIDFVEAAVDQCKKTIAKGNGEPISDRIRKMTASFKDLGVNQDMIEDYLGHKMDLTTPEEIADLTAVFTSLRDKQAKRSDFFNIVEDSEEKQSVIDKLKPKVVNSGIKPKVQDPIPMAEEPPFDMGGGSFEEFVKPKK